LPPWDMTLVLLPVAVAAGVLGALLGLGGGILLVPILLLGLHVRPHYAAGASLVSVIATSSGSAAAYVRDRITSLRVGMLLELATTTGAVTGAFLLGHIGSGPLAVLFGLALMASSVGIVRRHREEVPVGVQEHPLAARLGLGGRYVDSRLGREVEYRVARVPAGFAVMFLAGVLSGLLGIGSGVFKVLGLDTFMRLPFKVSTATSNFMMGVTAAASAGYYFAHGYINPGISAPVALGVLLGAHLGARLMVRLPSTALRWAFLPVLLFASLEMILKGLGL
jgi:uncharacterized membrane protein YfcA